MSTSIPFQSGPRQPTPRPFPTRGVPGGWHDPWDGDPLEAVVAALRQRNALRRQVTEADVQVELLAQPRADGRWEAHVVSRDGTLDFWPSVNGPTATSALDALEAELRELLRQSRGPRHGVVRTPVSRSPRS
jgi:hypothetical protein